MLTATACKQAKPLQKPYKLFDAHGLFLLVMPNSAKYWRLKYQYLKKEKLLALGVYPDVSLLDARDKQAQARKLIASGEDPAISKHRAKRAALIHQANTFEAVALEWHEATKSKWNTGHAANVLRSMQQDIFPHLGKLPIADITAPDVLFAARKVEARGALDVAGRVKQRCTAVFRYAIATGRTQFNPAADLRGVLKTRETQHHKHIPATELPEFLSRLGSNDRDSPITLIALAMLMLTFVRQGELRGAKWTEFDLNKRLWLIPAERMKMGTAHTVPLSNQVIQLLEQLRPHSGHREYLFPNAANPLKCMSENALGYCMNRMGYHGRATPHGFRGTASTILNEKGFRPDVIERQLSHQERNQVRRAYNHAEYLEERIEMMQHWADYLDQIRPGNKVVYANFEKAA